MYWLDSLLPDTAKKYPERIALRQTDEQEITFRSLDELVSSFAETLTSHGVEPGDRIGIFLPKNIQSVAAIFATLRTTSAYVPVDANGPLARATYILKDCAVSAVFVDKRLTQGLKNTLGAAVTKVIELDAIDLLFCAPEQSHPFPADLAYVLYTSGSTGQPKGVMITHENARCFVEWAAESFGVSDRDVLSSIAPFHFDLSVFDLFVALHQGTKLILFDQQATKNPMLIAEKIGSEKITVLYATPTLLQLLLSYGKLDRYEHQSLRSVLYAGEVFPPTKLSELWEKWPAIRVFNLYGPTETNVVTSYEVNKALLTNLAMSAIPIGKACPFANCRLLLNGVTNVEPMPEMKGELLVSGRSVAQGYQGLLNQTRASFFEESGERWYRTGDLVTVDQAGNFIFAGRKDRMVKRNGYRIELAEIELALLSLPNFAAVAVVNHQDKKGAIKITAFIRLSADLKDQPTLLDIRASAQQLLPDYLLPNTYRILENFPMTSSQKVDFQQLKASL